MRVREIKIYIHLYGDPVVQMFIETDKSKQNFELADEDLKNLKSLAKKIARNAERSE